MNILSAAITFGLFFAVGYGLMMTGITFSCGIIIPSLIAGAITGVIVK
jgi:hypothetical protein